MAVLWRIGEIAKRAGVKPSTLRYYEARGILQPAVRAESGYRLYHPNQLPRLQFILQAKKLGLSLNQIRWIIQQAETHEIPCQRVEPLIQKIVARLDERIHQLRARREALSRALHSPAHAASEAPCPILAEAIEIYNNRRDLTMARTIEVFTANCPLCDETVQRVKQAVAHCGCTVVTRAPDSPEAQQYGVKAVPTIAVDGQILFIGVPTQEQANAMLRRSP